VTVAMSSSLQELKIACDLLATYHRDSGDSITTFSGQPSGILIVVTSDLEARKKIEVAIRPRTERKAQERNLTTSELSTIDPASKQDHS
jgi:hypothetical protein